MRSLSRREKMSQPRSPRWVCSMTVGMMKLPMAAAARRAGTPRRGSAIRSWCFRLLGLWPPSSFASASGVRPRQPSPRRGSTIEPCRIFVGDLSLGDQHIKRLLLDDLRRDLRDALLPLQLGAQLLGVLLARGRELGDALLHVGVAGGDALALGDGLHQDARRAPPPRRRRGTPGASCAVVELPPRRRCRPSSSWRLGAVDDGLRVPLDERGRDREVVALDQLLDQLLDHLAADALLVGLDQALADLVAQARPASRPRRCPWPARRRSRAASSRAPP